MKAILIKPTQGISTLELAEIDPPVLSPADIRIRVHAASVNRADLLTRSGAHIPSTTAGPPVAGLDAAGEVIEVGADVTSFKCGDRIMAMVAGGLAEEVVLPAAMAITVPSAWSWVEGAAAVLGLMTEFNALAVAGHMTAGDTVVVHAATSGVGTQAVQLARELGAAVVIGTSRSPRPVGPLKELGLDHLIVTSENDFDEEILRITDGVGADVILDHVGGPYLASNIRAAAVRGRIVGVGRLGGSEGILDMEELARKRLEIIGTTFRTRTPEEKIQVVRDLCAGVNLDDAADRLRPVVDQIFPWTRALEAQEALNASDHIGKIVLQVQ
ncbi:zinc-binding dehydrogenase [Paeniglutamicibacter sp. MACA_103]|uniref:zinc-binding dehydrogenase n=1 Tax=Paeniglutamicibacter sp. MACA_103 TaxID=3377337 RepID=UPI00389475D1